MLIIIIIYRWCGGIRENNQLMHKMCLNKLKYLGNCVFSS